MSLKQHLEGTLTVLKREDPERIVYAGFGIAAKPQPSEEPGPLMTARHFYWPDPTSEEQRAQATVVGPSLGHEDRERVEALALAAIEPLKKGATHILWRAEPQWECERSFETMQTSWRFRVRGSFLKLAEP